MSASLTIDKEVTCALALGSNCFGEPIYKHKDKQYCVLHFPSDDKGVDFEKAFRQKVQEKDFNFSNVWFPEPIVFSKFDFNETLDFSSATFGAIVFFNGANFEAANFIDTTFSAPVFFQGATFSALADFADATFSKSADFSSAHFIGPADFTDATFSDADFRKAIFTAAADFSGASFSRRTLFGLATFENHIKFVGKEKPVFGQSSSLDLQSVMIEKPDRVLFHSLSLHPHWFVNADPRKFDFTNVLWSNLGKVGPEIELLRNKQISSPYQLLAGSCRRLAVNAEESNRYPEASNFRRMAMDAERLETWRGFDFRQLNWWYWLASGYGERPFQAFVVLLGVLLLFGLLFTSVGFVRPEPRVATPIETPQRDEVTRLNFSRALTYSAGVMTLQKPEPRPATTTAQSLVLLETIIGPVQAALLALAIRRKFMR